MSTKSKTPSPKIVKNTPDLVRKPLNAFFLYKQSRKQEIIIQYGVKRNCDISKIASEMWKNENEEIKNAFTKQAEIAYKEHKEKYPDFIWPSKGKKFKESRMKPNLKLETDVSTFQIDDFTTGWTPSPSSFNVLFFEDAPRSA
ncbi:hypothetical protein HDV06_002399 [Boothiomyces sp. JEL0866]|nr:hypothetical protein HDV06_002399 [Boothiomyces sp. JEL0866]